MGGSKYFGPHLEDKNYLDLSYGGGVIQIFTSLVGLLAGHSIYSITM